MPSLVLIALAAASTAAPAAQAVRPQMGLWSLDAVVSDGKQMHGRMCVGSALPEAWKMIQADFGEHCKGSRRREGNQIEGEFTCTFDLGGSTSTNRIRFTAGSRLMRMTIDTEIKGEGSRIESHLESVSAYVGACPSNLKPGQMQDSTGAIIDLAGGASQEAPASPPGGA